MASPDIQAAHHELFSHGADIGVRGTAWTEQAAFEQAALALTSIMLDPEKIQGHDAVYIHCQAPNDALLFVDWLNALIYEADCRKMAFGRFKVRLEDHRLEGIAWGDQFVQIRQEFTVEAKGATYTELLVAQQGDGRWIAQCVVDV